MIRYHSFYPYVFLPPPPFSSYEYLLFPHIPPSLSARALRSWHRENAYTHLTAPADEKALAAVRAFNPYDLYSKSDGGVDVEGLRPYYQRLIAKYFPAVLEW
jgi:hypothetical protein